ncbi:hypothetical protein Sango_1243200 [Sesamum angolense]|uniref:Retrotransposon gag domain-containing protein n=1 Tax=Sesamum angolense TaxID=2727404 RepID=A0AAE1WR00_9LAMI|nr:hypothetical protein Sango_1243200 [Sesamum angolense]
MIDWWYQLGTRALRSLIVERSEKNINEVQMIIAALAVHHSMNVVSSVMESTEDSHNSQVQQYQIPTKCSKVEFPKFDGDNLRGWVFKCEQFFEVDDTPSDAKVKLAAMHLESRALQWHQVYMKSRLTKEVSKWEEYVKALYNRFGTQLYDDPMAELMNLKQAYVVSCLLAGLRSDIAVQVRMFYPKNLQEAVSLAKLLEQAIYLTNKRSDESKAICALDNGDVDAAHNYYVSMHVMTGLPDYRTMRATWNVRDKPMHILIDTGSTHNFLYLETAKRLGCKLDSTEPFPVA